MNLLLLLLSPVVPHLPAIHAWHCHLHNKQQQQQQICSAETVEAASTVKQHYLHSIVVTHNTCTVQLSKAQALCSPHGV
jgi:hypothetical protein